MEITCEEIVQFFKDHDSRLTLLTPYISVTREEKNYIAEKEPKTLQNHHFHESRSYKYVCLDRNREHGYPAKREKLISILSLASPRFSLSFFQGVGSRVREKGVLFVAQGYPPFEPEAVRQAQGAQVPGPAYHRLLPRDGAQHRLHKRGIHGNLARAFV